MSELVIARIKRELAAVDGFNNDLYGSLADGSNISLHRWVEIKALATQHKGVGAAEIEALIPAPVSAAKALYLLDLIDTNPDPRLNRNLLALLDHDYWLVRRGACRVLGRTRDPEVRDQLEQQFTGADEAFRPILAEALAELGSQAVPEYLAGQVRGEDQYAKLQAISALAKLRGNRADELLLEALCDKGDYAADSAERELMNPERNSTFLRDRLRELCVTGHARAKVRAVELLNAHRDVESLPLLTSMYEDGSRKLRCKILVALGNMGTREAMAHVLRYLPEADIETTAYSCVALGKLPFPEAVEALMALYRERRFGEGRIDLFMHTNLYALAAECLKRNRCPEATGYMIELLDSELTRVREEMAKGLGTRLAVEALEKMESVLARESDARVKGALERACTKLRKHAAKGSVAAKGRKKKGADSQ